MISKAKTWVIASRAETLSVSIAPVVIGTTVAYSSGFLNWPVAFLCFAFAILVHLIANFANDYFDLKNGVDTAKNWGELRIKDSGLITTKTVKRAMILLFVMALLTSIPLIVRCGMPMALICISSILVGFLYTAGPYPLGYLGLGDISALIFFGPVATAGTYYAQTLSVNPNVILVGLVPGFISTAILVVNDLRDRDSDASANKRSLSVIFGKRFSQVEYLSCILLAVLCSFYFFFASGSLLCAFLSVSILVFAIPPISTVFKHPNSVDRLNKALELTAKLHIFYIIIFLICTAL